MPTREAIVDSVIPREVERPIPIRVITTRTPKKAEPAANPDQQTTIRNDEVAAAASATPAESVKLSPQLTALARKEQAHRHREQALIAREKELEEKLKRADKFSTLEEKLKAKDYSEAEALGLSYEGYTEYLLNKQNGEKPENQAFKALADEVSALKKSKEESADQEFQETVSEYRKEVGALVASDARFISVKEDKQEDAVLQLILDSWEEDGKEVTVEQAAQDVEDFIVAEATRYSGFTKIKARSQEADKKALPPPKPSLKTLTQQVVVGAEKRPQKSLQHLSESERYAEARRRVLERRAQEQGNR